MVLQRPIRCFCFFILLNSKGNFLTKHLYTERIKMSGLLRVLFIRCFSVWNHLKINAISYTDNSVECKWNLNQASGEFSSPYFPSNYHNFQDCQWKITAPRDHVIRLQFGVFELEFNPSLCGNNRCRCDYVDIQQESLKGDLTTLGRYCATISSLPIIQSSTNKMIVTLHSDHVITAKGFNASYMTVPKLAGWILLAD